MTDLIKLSRSAFTSAEIAAVRARLDPLSDQDRTDIRDQQTRDIANLEADSILIVSGPGTGKSFLFKERIRFWLSNDPAANIRVTTFVRKLIHELDADIDSEFQEQSERITASTLHALARSVVERDTSNSSQPLKSGFMIIGGPWKEDVWQDVQSLADTSQDLTLAEFERRMHEEDQFTEVPWRRAFNDYERLCCFYNAAGFSDLIRRATASLKTAPSLSQDQYFIIDESQDFNPSEDALVAELTRRARGVLKVGDDDQVLYEFRSGTPEILRNAYTTRDSVKAMLPFCSRCSYHIVKAASAFIDAGEDEDRLEKVFLPRVTETQGEK